MNELLLSLENRTGLGPTFVSDLLGYAYSTYSQYRSGARPFPLYGERHVQALLVLPQTDLDVLIKEHVFNGRRKAR